MRLLPYAVAIGIVLAVLFAGAGLTAAQSQPNQVYGGGYIHGYVYGFTMYDQLVPLDWVPITAENDHYSFTAYTGGNGTYEMFLPAGSYLLSIEEPGYKPYNMSISVADGASMALNFYLYQSGVPVPEFPAPLASVIMVFALAVALLAKKAKRKN